MEQKLAQRPAAAYAIVALTFFGVGCFSMQFIHTLPSAPLMPAWTNFGATAFWVNGAVAAGTLAAAATAVWAALSERRNRRQDRLVVGRLTAAGVAQRLETAAGVTSNLSEALDVMRANGAVSAHYALNLLKSIQAIPRCEFDELRCMSAMPGDCAILIAAAQDRLHSAAAALRLLSASGISNTGIVRETARATDAIGQAAILYRRAKSICDAETGGIRTVLEMYAGS
ncbi:hypothetical protein DM39_1542 [Burkholderia cenocepacia]|uniref:Lipoprotein n=1 Tax=Burkholderia cenocepacia TaxID=95486 RepID=A0AAN0RU73_9BURK|nr:hypothetical protein DM39_1542 [Burkholderia cenocepacia]